MVRDEQDGPLAEKIHTWLKDSGYPLEQQVEAVFVRAGFEVHRGLCYDDEDRGESRRREIDVVAVQGRRIPVSQPQIAGHGVDVTLALYVECKHTAGKPWVIFTSARKSETAPGRRASPLASALGEFAIYSLDKEGRIRENPLFRTAERVGFSGVLAFKKDPNEPDQVYRALHAASAAAHALKIEDPQVPKLPEACHIGFPVVVTDSPLFECWFDAEAAQERVEERKHIRVDWHGARFAADPVRVDVVTYDGLEDFAKEMLSGCNSLLHYVSPKSGAWMAEIHAGGLGSLSAALRRFRGSEGRGWR